MGQVDRTVPLLVLGATGRIGGALRAGWPVQLRDGLRPVWQARVARPGFLHWDMLAEPCPPLAASGVVLCLAGVTRGDGLDLNSTLALAALQAAADQGARHVFLCSSAAVYQPAETALAETAPTVPAGAYGAAKLAMERAALAYARPAEMGLTLLRIGNIAGLDALLGNARDGVPVVLDPVPGAEGGPVRSYIGPLTLGSVLAHLAGMAARHEPLPAVLNIATPQPVTMAALLDAAGQAWHYGPPNSAVIPRVALNTARLQGLIRLPPSAGLPDTMVREWRGLAR